MVAHDAEWDLGEFPIAFFPDEPDPDTIWADGVALDSEPIETLIERRHNQIADHHDAQMVGVLTVPARSISKKTMERISNEPFVIIPVDPTSPMKPEYFAPSPISGDFFQILNVLDGVHKEVTLNSPALLGAEPVGACSMARTPATGAKGRP